MVGPDDINRHQVMVLQGQLSELLNELWRSGLAQNLVYLQCQWQHHQRLTMQQW